MIQRPLGPIGHCSAKVRRMLEIEEDAALGHAVRVRKEVKDHAADKNVHGDRWSRPANMGVPGAFHTRFVSPAGEVTFHLVLQSVSRTSDGGCRITTPEGSKRLAAGAPAEHDGYIERPGAVETAIDPASFDGYASRPAALETVDGDRAIFSNIADSKEERQRYWRAVHEHERTPGPDRLTLVPEKASREAWQLLADTSDLPADIRKVATSFATTNEKRKTSTIKLDALGVDRRAARALVLRIAAILKTSKGKHAARVVEGRAGRSQYRLTMELPEGLDATGRVAIVRAYCKRLAENKLMYVAAIHAPDYHNDRRNHHLHIAFHDRPARKMGDRWDFEIAVPVKGQHKRVRYPYRQPKVGEWSRDPEGGNHRAYGNQMMNDLRGVFADLCNEQLDRLGIERKFHPGNLRSLGCDREVQKPLGTRAAPLEASGVSTIRGISNAELLWSAQLREAWEAAERRAKERASLRSRLDGVKRELESGSPATQALGREASDLAKRLDAAAAVLDRYDAELAEYDVTLAMGKARPNKVLDTCRRILAAIERGTASRAEQRHGEAIAARAAEAERFLGGLAAIEDEMAPQLSHCRKIVAAAQADIVAFQTANEALLDRRASVPSNQPTQPDRRATLDALFERIMADDLPVLGPTETGAGYRVPGITRIELAAIISPAFTDMAQKRLAALADLQAKRMRAAAGLIANLGLEGVERAAEEGQAGAARALRHARAYAAHPNYLRALDDALAQKLETATVRDKASHRGAGWTARLRDRIAGLVGHDAPTTPDLTPQSAAASVETATERTPPLMTREEAIASLATALLAEPALRVIKGKQGFVIDASDAPSWQTAATAFADEPSVGEATLRRYNSPWLDVALADRNALLAQLDDALRSSDSRPIFKTKGKWHVNLADQQLCKIVTAWRGYDVLADVLTRADEHWRAREDYVTNCPTSAPWRGTAVLDHVDRRGWTTAEGRDLGAPAAVVAPRGPVRQGSLGR